MGRLLGCLGGDGDGWVIGVSGAVISRFWGCFEWRQWWIDYLGVLSSGGLIIGVPEWKEVGGLLGFLIGNGG